MTRFLKAVKVVFINVVVLVLLLALLEGGASLLFITRQVLRTPGVSEQSHSRYHETIGWVSLPNVHLPHLYGPGMHLRTNAQGFRSDRDFTREVPPGKTRVVCSGDSFTLGFGVSNDQAWCQRLAALDARLEAVNMGQGGYGLDQVYLWYLHAGVALAHDVHLVAFITDDFLRMQSDRFLGYGKPLLGLHGDSIVVRNRPVPRTSSFTRWRASQGHAIGNLNMVQLAHRVMGRDKPATAASTPQRTQETRAIASRVFAHLERINRGKGSRLVLVHLPGPGDYRRNDATTSWREFVRGEAARQGITFVDMVDALRRVPPEEVNDLFAPNSHYSVAGNEFVARELVKHLAMP